MKVIIKLEDPAYGKTERVYDYPNSDRMVAICNAVNRLRNDHSARMYSVKNIRTARG